MVIGVDKAVIARLQHSGQKFEVLVDPDKALNFKKGTKMELNEILAYPAVYRDVRNSETVPSADLQKAFGTADVLKVAEKIIKNGELQLTTEQRRTMVEQRTNQIAAIISRKGINPQTNAPNPPQRVLNAMDKAGINVDPFVDAELQIEKVIQKIKPILPIKFQKITFQIKIGPEFAAKVFNTLKSAGTLKSEQWLNDGSLQVELEIPGGAQDDVFQKLSNLTHGQYESKITKKEDA